VIHTYLDTWILDGYMSDVPFKICNVYFGILPICETRKLRINLTFECGVLLSVDGLHFIICSIS